MLEQLGLSVQEEAVFDALVRRVQATVKELSDDCDLSVHHASRVLKRLAELGLATRLSGRPARYAAVPPDIGIEALLRNREDEIRDIRTHVESLMQVFRAGTRYNHPAELIEVVTGRDEVFQRAAQLQRSSQSELRAFDRPPYATRQPYATPNVAERELLANGVSCRVVYDRAVLEVEGGLTHVLDSTRTGERARIGDDVPLKLAISDDRMAIIPLLRAGDDAVTASYLIYPSPLLDALIALFEAVWSRSRPVERGALGVASTHHDRPADEDTKLLLLLASGLTDEAASRALGWSERTVQRHVHKLMDQLGVQTRLQVGIEANRRGWL